ncbi:hypothetical protein CYLTODRAFT_200429 [Cylindrobasidium torrendii FP15055 ss-10]|uniref:Uncharacterized protein n=1 Tax=Cylindrobasidium torrendii FP15055 ss-10 TaxID=1314674 RepID=A0A0D7BJ81_9AGAR|nr:hypothetical protein CYLTODRAFT_200429 [Cylindrobasidium torrendii FP15055 ss-10]
MRVASEQQRCLTTFWACVSVVVEFPKFLWLFFPPREDIFCELSAYVDDGAVKLFCIPGLLCRPLCHISVTIVDGGYFCTAPYVRAKYCPLRPNLPSCLVSLIFLPCSKSASAWPTPVLSFYTLT